MFSPLSAGSWTEIKARAKNRERRLKFGIDFLDDSMRGILPDDLILIGAQSGVGKTQLCCNIAVANMEEGKKVHYIALEAGEFELERRMKFPLILNAFLSDPQRPNLGKHLNYTDWLFGEHIETLAKYEDTVANYFESAYRDLFVMYKPEKFGVQELIEAVLRCSQDTSLIIIDHIHYFDLDDDNENRAIKLIAKTVRTLALEENIPIIMVAHLRKSDRRAEELCPGLEEFHGTSDLFKIATRVITSAPGRPAPEGGVETFFRVPKNRFDGSVSRFLAREIYSPKKGGYEHGRYTLGWSSAKRESGFAELDRSFYPDWSRRSAVFTSKV